MAQDHTLTLNVSMSKPLYDMGTNKTMGTGKKRHSTSWDLRAIWSREQEGENPGGINE